MLIKKLYNIFHYKDIKLPEDVFQLILDYIDESDYYVTGNRLVSVKPFKHFTFLKKLDLSYNRIRDVTDIIGLKKLEILKMRGNLLQDISNISVMKNLKKVDFGENDIKIFRVSLSL